MPALVIAFASIVIPIVVLGIIVETVKKIILAGLATFFMWFCISMTAWILGYSILSAIF